MLLAQNEGLERFGVDIYTCNPAMFSAGSRSTQSVEHTLCWNMFVDDDEEQKQHERHEEPFIATRRRCRIDMAETSGKMKHPRTASLLCFSQCILLLRPCELITCVHYLGYIITIRDALPVTILLQNAVAVVWVSTKATSANRQALLAARSATPPGV